MSEGVNAAAYRLISAATDLANVHPDALTQMSDAYAEQADDLAADHRELHDFWAAIGGLLSAVLDRSEEGTTTR